MSVKLSRLTKGGQTQHRRNLKIIQHLKRNSNPQLTRSHSDAMLLRPDSLLILESEIKLTKYFVELMKYIALSHLLLPSWAVDCDTIPHNKPLDLIILAISSTIYTCIKTTLKFS